MLTSKEVLVTNVTPIEITSDRDGRSATVIVKNTTATATIYLGDKNVTAGDGYPWEAGDGPLSADVSAGALFALSAGATQTVRVLESS